MKDFSRLFRFVRPYYPQLGISFALLILFGLFEVGTTSLAIPLFDKVLVAPRPKVAADSSSGNPVLPAAMSPLTGKSTIDLMLRGLSLIPGSVITQISIALIVLTLLKGICLYYSNYIMSKVGQGVVMDLRNQLYQHVIGQSMGFFTLNSTGNLMSRMNSDVEQVQEAVSTSIAELIREVVLLAALVAQVFIIDWKLASLSLLIAPAALTLTLTMGRRIRRASLKSRENIATLSDLLQQSITGVRIVKAFGMESYELSRFVKASIQLFRVNLRAARILFINSPAMEFLGVVSFIPLLYYAHDRIVSGTLTLGLFGGSLFALFRMYDPIRKLSRIHVGFQRAFASTSRIMDLLETHVEIQDARGARDLPGISRSIEFQNVSFSYNGADGSSAVLKDISLAVECRQVVAFVGGSGSGKSTLLSLIPRFYEAAEGVILIDGVDIREYRQSSLRRNIALVTQETFLFNDTVRGNITYGDRDAGEERIIEAAKAALAHDFIMQMPLQYDTIIGERGQRLSGGERQRIAIARAILKNAPILILDEATSALDSESEKLVQQALSNLMRDRTTFVIAHRLSTIRNADLIVVLDQGRIAEKGNHDQLMDLQGLYHKYFRLQTESPFESQDDAAPYRV